MICCDSCPFAPTCEEEDIFLASIGLASDDEWGEEFADEQDVWYP
jgi:hypothetical protein